MHAPGPFFYLVRDGVVSEEQLAALLERLPPERHVTTAARGGEAFDSTRWPLAFDAALASFIARRDPDPAVTRALAAVRAAAGDPVQLRVLARIATARMFAADGGDAAMYSQLFGADPTELAVFDAAPAAPATARRIAYLHDAHYAASDGLYAYHLHRGLPGPAAESVAHLARRAIDEGLIAVDELVAAALTLVAGHDAGAV